MPDRDCRTLLSQLSDYIDGDLDPARGREIEQHVDGCSNCRAVVETLKETVAIYHVLPRSELSPDAAERLCNALGLSAPMDQKDRS